jgi:autotransporter adhesin
MIRTNFLRSSSLVATGLCVLGIAAPVNAQIFIEPDDAGPFLLCASSGALQISDVDDNCEANTENVESLTFGSGANNVITFTNTGTANFTNTTVQMSGLQAYSGTSTFNSTVSFVGPSVTFDTGATFNGSASFGEPISTQGIFNTGSISSTNVFAANGGITDLSSASVDIELSLSMQNGANIDMGGNQIHNVATGTAATDAVNVAQLNAVNAEVAEDIFFLDAVTSAHTDQITAIQAVDATQTSQIAALEATNLSFGSDINTLFDLRKSDRRDMKQGVASAMAMAAAPMPSGPGRIAYAVNGATFRGEYAVGGSLTYRLNTRAPMAVNVGFSYAGNKNNGARIGVAGEF